MPPPEPAPGVLLEPPAPPLPRIGPLPLALVPAQPLINASTPRHAPTPKTRLFRTLHKLRAGQPRATKFVVKIGLLPCDSASRTLLPRQLMTAQAGAQNLAQLLEQRDVDVA